jgi:hypothetical protein
MNVKNINKRFKYLDKILDKDQDKKLYDKTKSLLKEYFKILKLMNKHNVLIGVSDEGTSIAEWQINNLETFIRIIPKSNNCIEIEFIKKEKNK